MTVIELIVALEKFDPDMEVRIGMQQTYGSDFAMDISHVGEYDINGWYTDNFRGVVITEGKQIGTVDYDEED